jgi:DNA-binding SARP family transcriptional activator
VSVVIEFSILGPLRVHAAGEPVAVPGGRQRALLALLLAHHDRVVTTSRAIDHLWPDDLPDDPANALQQAVSKLRRALGAEGLVETGGGGYRLVLGGHRLDALDAERLVAEGRRAAAAGDHARAVEVLRRAAELWRGAPFGPFGELPLLEAEAARLAALRLAAIEERIDAELALGRVASTVIELDVLVRRHPTHERLHCQLMLALYRAGRQADALEAYRRAYRELSRERGIAPGPLLRTMERRILRQDPTLDPPPPPPRRPPRTWTVYPLLDAVQRFVAATPRPGPEVAALLLAVTEAINDAPASHDMGRWIATLDEIEEHVNRALDWCAANDPELGLRLAAEACLWWDWRGRLPHAALRLRRLLDVADGPPSAVSRALAWLAFFQHQEGDAELAAATVERARVAAVAAGDRAAEGAAAAVESVILRESRPARAVRSAERAVLLLTQDGTLKEVAYASVCLALAHIANGEVARARMPLDDAQASYAEIGDLRGEAWIAGVQSRLAEAAGDGAEADRLRRAALTFANAANDEATRRWMGAPTS